MDAMDTNLNDVPMIRYDDMSTFEDEIWNNEEIETGVSKSGLMGTKLDLPPVRQRMGGKPSKLTIIQPPSRPVSRAQGGVTPTPGPEVPGLGPSPTFDFEFGQKEEVNIYEASYKLFIIPHIIDITNKEILLVQRIHVAMRH